MSREPIIVDASAWTGLRAPQWPDPKDYPYPRAVHARASPYKHAIACVGLFLVTLSAVKEVYEPSKPGMMRMAGLALGGLGAAVGCCFMLRQFYRAGTSAQLAVAMDGRGLSIPVWFEKVVPWSEIVDARYGPWWHRHHSRGMHITIRNEARFKPTAARAHPNGPLFTSFPQLLTESQKDLYEAIQAYRAHFGNSGRPN